MKKIKITRLTEQKDMSELSPDVIASLEKNIRNGAKDLTQKWANALELVHKSFEVANIQRPTPTMKAAWDQYTLLIKYAVEQLAKLRGLKGDWRSTSLDID